MNSWINSRSEKTKRQSMDQPKPLSEVSVLTAANDPEEAISGPLGLESSEIGRKNNAKKV